MSSLNRVRKKRDTNHDELSARGKKSAAVSLRLRAIRPWPNTGQNLAPLRRTVPLRRGSLLWRIREIERLGPMVPDMAEQDIRHEAQLERDWEQR